MPRLPQPGPDKGAWGELLNEFLRQSHSEDGSIKPSAVGASQIATGTVAEDKLSSAVQTKLNTTLVNFVNVATGSEARPDSALVLWVGGTVRPTNMGSGDIWFEESA